MSKYPNPITSPGNIRDPFIMNLDGVYYLLGTQAPFWEGPCPGVKLFRSTNLVDWEFVSWMVRRADFPEDAWYIDRLWAPELLRRPEGFYLTFNGRNHDPKHEHPLGTAIAFSQNIEGPYRVLTPEHSAEEGLQYPAGEMIDDAEGHNDASLYEDENGVFMYYCNPWGIWGVQIDLPSCQPVGEAFCCVRPCEEGGWDRKIEGPHVTRQNGKYYLYYSSFSGPYSMGVVTADSPRGPWSSNPPVPTFSPAEGVTDAGHNAVFTDRDGSTCICYHAQRVGDRTEYLCIDEVRYEDGRVWAVESEIIKEALIKSRA